MARFSNQENFYKRLRELGHVDAPAKSTSLDSLTLVEYSRANDGSALGIIKENDSFYIKSSNVKGDKIDVSDFTYIGGLENKLKYKFHSLSEAIKSRNFYVSNLNESMERGFQVGLLKEEKEILNKKFDGGIANAQQVADKSKGGSISDNASEKAPDAVTSTDGIANAQQTADANKGVSNGAASVKPVTVDGTTSSGADRGGIAGQQETADKTKGGSIAATAPEKAPDAITSTAGVSNAQQVADKTQSATIVTKPKEVEPASDAKKEAPISLGEAFGAPDQDPAMMGGSADVSVSPQGAEASAPMATQVASVPDGAANPETSSPDGAIGQAASALDNLDMAGGMPSGDMGMSSGGDGSAIPSPDMGGVDMDGAAAGLGDLTGGVDGGMGSQDDAALKDIEKLVGKTGQKIRSSELSDEMVAGFLKSLITSFDGKLANLDADTKRELSNKILKAGEEGEMGAGEPASTEPVGDVTSSEPVASSEPAPSSEPAASSAPSSEPSAKEEPEPDDKDIEEAINQHLQENKGGKMKPFVAYASKRGYTNEELGSTSVMEMASLVSGYANECGDNFSDSDAQTIAEYMNEDIMSAVSEAGHKGAADKMKPFVKKGKNTKKATPSFMDEELEAAKKIDEYGDEHPVSTADAVNGMQPKIQETTVADEKAKVEEAKDKVTFASPAQSFNKEEKKEEVSESVDKLKKIIKVKIEERLGIRKPTLNESSKSKLSKKIDEMIDMEIKNNKDFLKNYSLGK